MKLHRPTSESAFTLIELLVVISIIAILAGIALPVFGEVQVRGNQTKALSNAKQVGLACRLYSVDNNEMFPMYTDADTKTGTPSTSNDALQTLMPDYIPDKTIFSIPKSAFCKKSGAGSGSSDQYKLQNGQNEWAYVMGLSATSNARYPLIADGFVPGSESGEPKYSADEGAAGGVWKGKKAVVIRVDSSGTVETCNRKSFYVPRDANNLTKNLFAKDSDTSNPWLTGATVLNPTE